MSRVRLFGLTIDSEIPLPGLVPAPEGAPVDVTIRRAHLAGEADLVVEEAGAFAVRGGCEILVDAAEEMPERNVRLYLLGSAMGMLLHQRGLLPLHANAVALDGASIAVAGPSGAGKSTLAAWLTAHGQKLVGDDVVVVRHGMDGPIVHPGVPRLRLWGEALDHMGFERGGFERSYVDEGFDKWDVPVAGEALAAEGLPLAAIYVLEDGPEIAINRLSGAAAVAALFDHTYRGQYVARTGGQALHFRSATALALAVPVFRLRRPRDLSRLDLLGQSLLGHARAQVARTGGAAR
ncbi:hypothetical protein [Sphingomonas sp. LHG3406-1]|uniref:hypothetical protein n=1 Tax=Sphingomonas sp. LHG3406-1 TaxID=2804617 RepID=UPI0026146489|nr:hypothetical protein [Sphingomonas sp. LHG3406-1]